MNCFECGAEMKSGRGVHPYDQAGVRIVLENVEIRECPKCGEREAVIQRIEELHRVIAQAIIQKPAPLAAEEVVFLRKLLGWSAPDLAKHLAHTKETISRIENGHVQISAQSDRLLRALVSSEKPAEDFSLLEAIDAIDDKGNAKPIKISLRATGKSWKALALVACLAVVLLGSCGGSGGGASIPKMLDGVTCAGATDVRPAGPVIAQATMYCARFERICHQCAPSVDPPTCSADLYDCFAADFDSRGRCMLCQTGWTYAADNDLKSAACNRKIAACVRAAGMDSPSCDNSPCT